MEETNQIRYEPTPEEPHGQEPYAVGPQLTIGDGFRFGCGFIFAGVAFFFAAVIALALLYLATLLLGVPVPLGR